MHFKLLFLSVLLFLATMNVFSAVHPDTVVISQIRVTSVGLQTKHAVIYRELSFHEGDMLTWEKLLNEEIPRSISNLKNLNLFNQIEIIPEFTDQTTIINIELIEKWYLWPIPYMEFADRNINQWSALDFDLYRTNLGFYLFKYNLFGLNHTLKATVGTGYTTALGIEYRAPYIDRNKKLGFKLDLRHKANHEIRYGTVENKEQFFRSESTDMIQESNFLTEIEFRPGLYVRHRFTANYNKIKVADTVVSEELNKDFLFDHKTEQRLIRYGYHLSFDNRNNKLFPLTGIFADVGIDYYTGSQNFMYVGFDLNFYRPLPLNRLYSGLSYTYGDAINQNLPYVLNKAIGLAQNVRGYENFLFLGDQFAVLRAELRYLIVPERDVWLKYMPVKSYKSMPIESYLSAFYDQAQVIDNGFQTELYGFGVGINTILYYDKVLRFEYSWNHWNSSGLKVHFKKAF